MDSNTRVSEIRIDTLQQEQVRRIMLNPVEFIPIISRDYFFKGKRDKLLALRALEVSNIEKIVVRSNENGLAVIPCKWQEEFVIDISALNPKYFMVLPDSKVYVEDGRVYEFEIMITPEGRKEIQRKKERRKSC